MWAVCLKMAAKYHNIMVVHHDSGNVDGETAKTHMTSVISKH